MFPNTVARAVVTLSVLAAKVMPLRALTHVSNEVLKLVPTLTHLDTAPSVTAVSIVFASLLRHVD